MKTRFSSAILALCVLLLPGALRAETGTTDTVALDLSGSTPAVGSGKWADRAARAIDRLDATWWNQDGWQGAGGWQRFVLVDTLIAYRQRTGDARWDDRIHTALRTRTRLALNDDALWSVIASVDGWQLEGDPELLDYAAKTFAGLVASYWDNTCGGGIWWNPRRTYKNAITNELLLTASTRLYRATGQAVYRDWALRTWGWLGASGMIGSDGLVNDGLAIDAGTGTCRNNGQPQWTYNQGVLLSGLSDLSEITGNPVYRHRAVVTALNALEDLTNEDGTLREPVPEIGVDGLAFKGIFAFHLAYLMDALPEGADKEALRTAARRNAEAIWAISGEGAQAIDADWTGRKGQYGAAAQMSGIAMLLAADR